MEIKELAQNAKKAAIQLSGLRSEDKDKGLLAIAHALEEDRELILRANEEDMAQAEGESLAAPLLKRLRFDDRKLDDVIEGIKSLLELPDPVGKTLLSTELDKGLELYRISCPIGVIGIIFESRPDALVQISTLCLKSGNGVLLKGGREAARTNKALYNAIVKGSQKAGLPSGWIVLMENREDVNAMLKLDGYVDLIIPRGSNAFVQYIMDNSRIPVMGHADGICHCYVDKGADLKKAVAIVTDSKTQYVAVCNALETLLVHEEAAKAFLPLLKTALDEKQVLLKGCDKTRTIIDCQPAEEEDWKTEYLDYILSIKVVSSLEEAVEHINTYGSGHTDAIVSEDASAVDYFLSYVDSGNVFANCSTRFSDGFKYGFGAEVGISTNKLHARGPVGLDGLVTYKYKLFGNGHIVADYSEKRKHFTHKTLERSL